MPSISRIAAVGLDQVVSTEAVLGPHLRAGADSFKPSLGPDQRERTLGRAEQAIAHKLDLFDQPDVFLGSEIDWNYEFKARKAAPLRPASSVDYRDYDETGDCKFVWEPNRHYQLLVLGRAHRLSGDDRFAEELVAQIESWIRQCPYGLGMNWRSPLELAIRLINWTWALELIRGSRALSIERLGRILPVVWAHLDDISRKYSRYSSANNHAIGEAAGVFIGATYFAGFRRSAHWQRQSRAILEREILRQTFADGGTREQATGYHSFVLQFFVLADAVARAVGQPFSDAFRARLERMFEFAHRLAEASDRLPMIGDADDGYVIDLGDRHNELRAWMAVGAVLFDRSDFKRLAGGFSETAGWLLGCEAADRFERIPADLSDGSLRSVALRESGYFLLQHGRVDAPAQVSLLMDCGELGFLSIAAHGHADALSVVLRVGGIDVLVDPGTYDYFTYPEWREYFRSTRAHNAVVVDDADQSEMLGGFLWGRRATARLLAWEPSENGGRVVGEHDGYTRLADPVIHRRDVSLDMGRATADVVDQLAMTGRHTVAQYWHFSEHCRVEDEGVGRLRVDFGTGRLRLNLDRRLTATIHRAEVTPIAGWVSRGYHRKSPSTTVIARGSHTGPIELATRIEFVSFPAALDLAAADGPAATAGWGR